MRAEPEQAVKAALGRSGSGAVLPLEAPFGPRTLSLKAALASAAGAIAAFHLAYASPRLSWLIIGYLIGLIQLARARSGRIAFYGALGVGLLTGASQLYCFWIIFGPSAIALWIV